MIFHSTSEPSFIGRQSWKGNIATFVIHAVATTLVVIWASAAAREPENASVQRTTLVVDLTPLAAPRAKAPRGRPAATPATPATLAKPAESTPKEPDDTKDREVVPPPIDSLAFAAPPIAMVSALPSAEAVPPQSLGTAVPTVSSAPPGAPRAARSAATASEGTSQPAIGAVSATSNWSGLVLGRLQQFKRYPTRARAKRLQGVSVIRFTMDRQGQVRSARIERSSGHEVLDREGVAIVHRAEPLPLPPPDITGDTIELVVPIEFFLTR